MSIRDYDLKSLVLHMDEFILAINKPAGLLSLPDGYDPELPHLAPLFEPVYGQLWMVHRLDQDTSGVVLMARTAEAHRHLNEQFSNREVEKTYHTVVAGSPAWKELRVTQPLLIDADRKHRTVVHPQKGKPAATRLRTLESYGAYSLIEARPETGRTHQIRVHLASQGLPICGDSLYGSGEGVFLSRVKPGYKAGRGEERPLIARLALHARRLTFTHPGTEQKMEITAPYPKDFEAALMQMRKVN
ncbi:MAG: RluA family pseudouridine synthase [Chloroflexi bacterium]|nr:MAG: RluA family pseudouridine synthase [Chloroflexota bacterium]